MFEVSAEPAAAAIARPRRGRGADLITIMLGTWLLVGVFVDGWAHNNLHGLETFFTPWHALLYSGYLAAGEWILWQLRPAVRGRRLTRTAVPLGYGLGSVGVVVFGVGGIADLGWHEVFGIEQDIQALFSPTHLMLFLGIALILSTPLRAAWLDPHEPAEPTYRGFFPVLASTTMLTAMIAFFFMYWAPFRESEASRPAMHYAADHDLTGFYIQDNLAAILLTTLVLVGALLLLARRWRLPLGTATTMYAVVAVLTNALAQFRDPELIAAALLAGLAVDIVLATVAPTPALPRRMSAVGALIPLATWVPYYAVLAAVDGLGQAAPVWTGSIVWAVLAGGALALLMAPPPVPVLDPPLGDARPYTGSGGSPDASSRSGGATVPPAQPEQEGRQHDGGGH